MLRKMLLVLLLTIAAKALAFGRDAVIAWEFGASGSTDAYFIAITVPGILWVAVQTTIASVFLPQYVLACGKSPAEGERLAIEALRSYVLVAAIFSFAVLLFARQIVTLAAPSAAPHVIDQAVAFSRIISFVFCLTAYVGVQNAIQQARGHFVAPMAVPVVNHSVTIMSVFLAAYLGDIRIAVIGGVAGWLLQVPIQRFQTRHLYRSAWGLKVRRETWIRLSALSAPVVIAVLLDQINIFVGTLLASDQGAGAISHINYASRLTMFAAGLFSWVLGYFLFPAFARNAGRGDDRENRKVLAAGLAAIICTTVPIVLCCLVLSRDIIQLVYGRGEFVPADVLATARAFGFYSLGIVFIALRDMLNRLFFSYQRTVVPLLIGIGATAVNLSASFLLSRSMGVAGIALGASIAAFLFALAQIVEILRWKRSLLSAALIRVIIANLVAGTATYIVATWLLPALTSSALLTRLVVSGAFICLVHIAIAFGMAALLKIDMRTLVRDLMHASSGEEMQTAQLQNAIPEEVTYPMDVKIGES